MNWLHEWRMKRKIRHILEENKKHPEKTFNLEDMFKQHNGNGQISYDTFLQLRYGMSSKETTNITEFLQGGGEK